MKFRKKPVVIEAVLYDGSKDSIAKVCRLGNSVMPYTDHLIIKTLEGNHRADIGDWIIKEVKGELYPCKPDGTPLSRQRIFSICKEVEKLTKRIVT